MPQGVDIFKEDFTYRDPKPEFIINRLKQRLGANDVSIQVALYGDVGPKVQAQGETVENWLRGVQHDLDPYGYADSRVREHQAADGLGCFELELMPMFTPPPMLDGMTEDEYDDVVNQARRGYGLPCRLNAPDPRSLYWPAGQDKPGIVVKIVNRPLLDVQNKWTAEGFRLVYKGGDKLDRDPYTLGGEVSLSPSSMEVGKWVRLVVISDDDWIYHCCYPAALTGPTSPMEDIGPSTNAGSSQSSPQLMLLAKYPNPLGRPPYYFASARRTADPDPAYSDLPIALETLEMAPYVSQLQTTQMVRAFLDATKPWHLKPRLPMTTEENAAPKNFPLELKLGFMEYDGDILPFPSNNTPDMDKIIGEVLKERGSYDNSIMGALQAGELGRGTPAWSVMQFNEETSGLLKEPLDQRAICWRELLLDVVRLVKVKYGKDGPVYVQGQQKNKKAPHEGAHDNQIGISASDLNLQFKLNVSIDALTQSQRASDTEYWRRLWTEDHIIARNTYQVEAGIQDPVTEDAKIDREAFDQEGKQLAYQIAKGMFEQMVRVAYPQRIADAVLGPAAPASPTGEPPTEPGPQAPPGAAPAPNVATAPETSQAPPYPSMPGLGQPIIQPGGPRSNGHGPATMTSGGT